MMSLYHTTTSSHMEQTSGMRHQQRIGRYESRQETAVREVGGGHQVQLTELAFVIGDEQLGAGILPPTVDPGVSNDR